MVLSCILKSIGWMYVSHFWIKCQYDSTNDIKIKISMHDLHFMVHWFCLIFWRPLIWWMNIILWENESVWCHLKIKVGYSNLYFMVQWFCFVSGVFLRWTSLAAFRYPHRTRPNSGPDQIILVLKLSTEPIRSCCCLHIRAKFWSAAAVAISEPISVS